jgi:hypothetical protein
VGSTKQDQAARRKATQDVIAANRPLFEERMRHYYAEMNLGEWKPKATPELRAAIKAAEEKSKAAKKIEEIAAKAGISVEIGDLGVPVQPEVAWSGGAEGFADEVAGVREALAETDDEPVIDYRH